MAPGVAESAQRRMPAIAQAHVTPHPDPEGLQLGQKGRRDQRGKTWVPSLTVGLAVTP